MTMVYLTISSTPEIILYQQKQQHRHGACKHDQDTFQIPCPCLVPSQYGYHFVITNSIPTTCMHGPHLTNTTQHHLILWASETNSIH